MIMCFVGWRDGCRSRNDSFDFCSVFFSARTRIVNPPQAMSAIKGTTVELPCGVVSDSSVDVTWQWFVEDTELLPGDTRLTIDQQGSLHITSVRNTDIATYTCFVFSVAGNDSAVAVITVIGNSFDDGVEKNSILTPALCVIVICGI